MRVNFQVFLVLMRRFLLHSSSCLLCASSLKDRIWRWFLGHNSSSVNKMNSRKERSIKATRTSFTFHTKSYKLNTIYVMRPLWFIHQSMLWQVINYESEEIIQSFYLLNLKFFFLYKLFYFLILLIVMFVRISYEYIEEHKFFYIFFNLAKQCIKSWHQQ